MEMESVLMHDVQWSREKDQSLVQKKLAGMTKSLPGYPKDGSCERNGSLFFLEIALYSFREMLGFARIVG